MTDLTVRKISTPAEFRAFFEFPWVLYRGDPNWVPPLLSMRRDLLDRRKNPSWEYLEGDHYGAWRGDRLVGTITAYVNHRHNEFHNENLGWFGTFDVEDDAEAAAALLNTAAEWARGRGGTLLRGPQTFTPHEEVGVLVDNFTRPILLMPYNYPYYGGLIEQAGFSKAMDVYSFHIDRAHSQQSYIFGRLERLTQAIMKRSKITVRPLNPKNKKADFKMFKDIYNNAWEKNWGFVPMTERELDALVESLGMFVDPRLAFFGYVDGDPAGFILPVPDLNIILRRAYPRPGVPEALTLVKAVWYWKVRRIIDWVRVPLMGVRHEYRNKGVDAVMYLRLTVI
jgi:hypothetical protein